MPIFDQGYQHWQGKLSGHAWRWWTITWHGVRAQLKHRWTRLIILFAWFPALILAVVLVLWGLLEQKSELVMPILRLMQLPDELMQGPRAFRVAVWTLSYHFFFEVETYFCMILVLMVGPNLISQDLRFNAIPLYFSRPLRRFDYFLGKLGVIGFFLAMVAIAPALLAYVLGVGFSLDVGIIKDTFRLLLGGVAYGMVIVVTAGSLMLALSSLSRNTRYVSALWIGIWFVSGAVSTVVYGSRLHQVDTAHRPIMMQNRMINRGRRPFDPEEFRRIQEEMERVQEERLQVQLSDWSPMLSFVGNVKRLGSVLMDTPSAWRKFGNLADPRNRTRILSQVMGPQYPWYWSGGILAGLMGISLWILSSRVKSLDRLK